MLHTPLPLSICAALVLLSGPLLAQKTEQKAAVQTPAAASDSPETARLRAQRDQLVLENDLRDETLRKEMAAQKTELLRFKLAAELAWAKADRELTQKRLEIERARTEKEEIAGRAALENARLQAETQKDLAALHAARERAEAEAALALAELSRKSNDYKNEEVDGRARIAGLKARLEEREQEMAADSYVEQRPVYLKDPLQGPGDLIISDRRIPLNGPITAETGDFVCERIDYFNNKNAEFPIFIVIDQSPGGSVMAGYKIIKSMQSSAAPVYVVVKSFAASMAAAICTLAQRSFAYPNAIILHHQISGGMRGNLTAQREGVKMLEEWWQRLAHPIAEKMGITVEEFSRQMYAHSSTGDWQEFADDAVKLKWVDAVVGRCQETALVRNPDFQRSVGVEIASASAPGVAGDGARSVPVLPRLSPLDCYYLYNPDGYYHME